MMLRDYCDPNYLSVQKEKNKRVMADIYNSESYIQNYYNALREVCEES